MATLPQVSSAVHGGGDEQKEASLIVKCRIRKGFCLCFLTVFFLPPVKLPLLLCLKQEKCWTQKRRGSIESWNWLPNATQWNLISRKRISLVTVLGLFGPIGYNQICMSMTMKKLDLYSESACLLISQKAAFLNKLNHFYFFKIVYPCVLIRDKHFYSNT